MRHAPRALLAGGLGFAVSLLAACGGGAGLLSGDQANTLNSQLDRVSSAVDAGNCPAAARATDAFSGAVAALPATINPTLKQDLAQGASTVGQLAVRDCHKPAPTTSTSTSPSTSSSSTSSTPTTSSSSTSSSSTSSTSTSSTSTSATSTSTTGTNTTGGVGVGGGGGNGNGGNGQ